MSCEAEEARLQRAQADWGSRHARAVIACAGEAGGSTAWSRVYDERHWASDVVLGAALGIATAKVVAGRWRVFGFRPPHFLIEPNATGLLVRIPIQ
jgi:hypothetical protein